jgi:hypothetical protein
VIIQIKGTPCDREMKFESLIEKLKCPHETSYLKAEGKHYNLANYGKVYCFPRVFLFSSLASMGMNIYTTGENVEKRQNVLIYFHQTFIYKYHFQDCNLKSGPSWE